MATAPPPKLKVPGESSINPNFAAPQVQTAPDVRVSQQVSGNAPVPTIPNNNSTKTDLTGGADGKSPPSPPPSTKPATPVSDNPTPATANPAPTVPTSTGAPPGVPATAPPPVIAPTPRSIEGKTAAEDQWIQAQNEHDKAVYDAALAYNGGPTSALEKNKLGATEHLRNATNQRGVAGTVNSSLFGNDKERISNALATANTEAYNVYQKAVREAGDAQEKAHIVFLEAGEREKREIEERAKKSQPTEPIVGKPVNPGGEKIIEGPAGEGGVVPYTETLPNGGYVHVGPPLKRK